MLERGRVMEFEVLGDLKTGRRTKRREDVRLTAGRGQYAGDKAFNGMLHAAFVRSPHAHANVLSVNVDAAREIKGVVAILTGADLLADGVKDAVNAVSLSRKDGTKVSQSHRQALVRDR